MTWFGLLSQNIQYLKKHADTLVKEIVPFIFNLYTQKQLALYRTPAISILIEIINKLNSDCHWKSSDIDSKIVYIHLKNIIDRNNQQYDAIAATRIGICLIRNGLLDIVSKYYGDKTQRVIDIILNDKLLKDLIRESILRFSCDPLFKDIFISLSQLEKQNEISKKMWKEYLQLGNSSNMVHRALFYEILVSFIGRNQNRKIFQKILKTKAMIQLTKNLDEMTNQSPYFSELIDRLSKEFALLNQNSRFRKLIFPSSENYKSDLADISKMVIFATGADKNIFNYIFDLPKPYPEAYLLNINNVDIENISEEFLTSLLDFSFIGNSDDFIEEDELNELDDENEEEVDQNDKKINGKTNHDNDDESQEDDEEEEAGALLSELIADHDDTIEKAQTLLLDLVNRCATWHMISKISKLVDHYKTIISLEYETKTLNVVFSESENNLRNELIELRDSLMKIPENKVDSDKLKAFIFLVEVIIIHQLYIPSLISEEHNVLSDLKECSNSLFLSKSKKEDAPEPVNVLLDIVIQLVSISPKLTQAAAFSLKYFLKDGLNSEIVDLLISVIQPSLTGQNQDEIFESNENGDDMEISEDEEDKMEETSFFEMEDKIDTSDNDEDITTRQEASSPTSEPEMINIEDIEGFDQDEYMFKQDEVLKQMFLIKKRELEREKSSSSDGSQVAYNASSSVLQIIETFVRHTYSAKDVITIFTPLLKLYILKLKKGQLKKFSAMTHQKILHVLSIIYKTPLLLNVDVADRKKEKGVSHKYYGRFDDQLNNLVKIFFEFIEVNNKLPSQQSQPILQFFKDIFVNHPQKDKLIVPLVQEQLNKKIMSSSKFSAPKSVAFLVSMPWMAESCGGLLPQLLNKFTKKSAEVYRFIQSCLDKKWNLFAVEGSFDELIQVSLDRLKADSDTKKDKISKNIKKISDPIRSVLKRLYTNPNFILKEKTKENIIQIATILNGIKPSKWAPILENTEKKQRKRKRVEERENEEKPKKRSKTENPE